MAAKTERDHTALLAEEKELVTAELQRALIAQGDRLRVEGNYSQALLISRLARDIAEQINDSAGVVQALKNIGHVHRSQGAYAQALEYYQKGLETAQTMGDKILIGAMLFNVGVVYFYHDNYSQSLD